jgi:hypothetical protein
MWHHFKFLPFLAGLIVGIIVFFYFKPESKERVIKWPRPENCGKHTYRDRNGLCYVFESQITDCDKVKESLQTYSLE